MTDSLHRRRNKSGAPVSPDSTDRGAALLSEEIEQRLRNEFEQLILRMRSPESSAAYDMLEGLSAKDLRDCFQAAETPLATPSPSPSREFREPAKVLPLKRDEEPELARLVNDTGRVLVAATELSGDFRRALDWFNTKLIEDFDGRSAAQLVADGKAEAVLAYLQTQQSGPTG